MKIEVDDVKNDPYKRNHVHNNRYEGFHTFKDWYNQVHNQLNKDDPDAKNCNWTEGAL